MAAGDILGLGGPDSTEKNLDTDNTPSAAFGEEEAKRRRRMNEGADEVTPEPTAPRRGQGGAAGVDMGSGGEGTGIE